MTDNIENLEIETTTEEVASDVVKAETLFFVVKDPSGLFKVITDVSTKVELARPANMLDIRSACQDILHAIRTRETAETVAALIKAQQEASK